MKKSAETITKMIVIALFLACGNIDTDAVIETIDGVKYIHNNTPLWGGEPEIALEFVRKIGDYDSTDDNFVFYKPRNIFVDESGNVYVLDAGNFRVQVFDSDLDYVKTIGRQGQGPAEFGSPSAVLVDENNNILVSDRSKNSILVFDQNGKEFERISLPVRSTGSFLKIGEELFLTSTMTDTTLISGFDSQGNTLYRFVQAKKYSRDVEFSIGVSINFPIIANFFSYFQDNQGSIIIVFNVQNRIEKYSSDGRLMFQADRRLNYDESSEPYVETRIVELLTLDDPTREKREMKLPVYNRISAGAGVDHRDRIWVSTLMNQPEYEADPEKQPPLSEYMHFEIFNRDGILLGYLDVPEHYTDNFKIFGDKIYFIEAKDEMCVYEYRIVEK